MPRAATAVGDIWLVDRLASVAATTGRGRYRVSSTDGHRDGRSAAWADRCLVFRIGRAHAGLWQDQFDATGGVPVPGDRRDDGAGLLVAGEHQERGRAAIALHANRVDVRIRVLQLLGTVRAHGPAAVQVRV